MAFNINDMKAHLQFEGARPNLFQVTFSNPANNSAFLEIPMMVQATEIPASSVDQIPVSFMGRNFKVAGDRPPYPDWNVRVINDEDFPIRNALEEWHARINGPNNNARTLRQYKSEAQVIQYGKDGSVLRTYDLHGVWPTLIGPISLSWEDNNSIEVFDVTFSMDYWTVRGKTGNAGGL